MKDDYYYDYYQYQLLGLNPAVEYEVHVRAYNQWGLGLPWVGKVVPERIRKFYSSIIPVMSSC